MPEKAKEMEVLQFMHDRLTSEMGDACPRQDQFFPIPSSGNSKLILLQMQTAIDQVRAESRTAAEELVFFNQIFLFIILGLLLSLNIAAGWLLHYNYRLTLIPLAQLARRLKHVNRDIPESIHDTAEEMKKDLKEALHSPDITQISQSIMSFCGDIEAKNKSWMRFSLLMKKQVSSITAILKSILLLMLSEPSASEQVFLLP